MRNVAACSLNFRLNSYVHTVEITRIIGQLGHVYVKVPKCVPINAVFALDDATRFLRSKHH